MFLIVWANEIQSCGLQNCYRTHFFCVYAHIFSQNPPIELHMQGTFQMIVFQLYPFVLKSFFDLSPQDLNDECFDLQQLENTRDTLDRLQNNPGPGMAVDRIAEYLLKVFDVKKSLLDSNIEQALRMMIKENGQLPLESLYERFPITPRTFQRRF